MDSGPPTAADDPQAELARWRLIARLSGVLTQPDLDVQAYADEAASILAEELGDAAVVVLVEPPDGGDPFAGVGHRDEERALLIRSLVDIATPDDLRRFAQDMDAEPAEVVTHIPATTGGLHEVIYSRYAGEAGVSLSAFSAVRSEGKVVAVLACNRDGGSAPYSEADLTALGTASEVMGRALAAVHAQWSERKLRRRWETMFLASPTGMLVYGPEGLVTDASPAACRIVGRSKDELIGLPWETFTVDDDLADFRANWAGMVAGPEPIGPHGISRAVRPDGAVRWVSWATAMVRNDDGSLEAVHVHLHDITDQYVAESEAALFASLVRSSPDFVAVVDLDGRGIFLNEAGRRLVGVPDDVDITNTTVWDFLPKNTDRAERLDDLRVIRERGHWETQNMLRDWRDDSEIPVLSSSFLVNDRYTGEPVAVATIRRDRRQELLREAELARVLEQRGVLLRELLDAETNERRKLADELHDDPVQLLSAAQLRLDILERRLAEAGPDAQGALEHVKELVTTSLDQLRLVLADLDPPEERLLTRERVLEGARVLLGEEDAHKVTVEGDLSDLPTPVAAALYRVVREAIANAQRHAQASHIAVTLGADEDFWMLRVEDDGVGIADDAHAQRGHRGVPGMRSRIRALEGTLRIQRRPTGGTCVDVRVPRSANAVR